MIVYLVWGLIFLTILFVFGIYKSIINDRGNQKALVDNIKRDYYRNKNKAKGKCLINQNNVTKQSLSQTVNNENEIYFTQLYMAALNGNYEAAKEAIGNGAEVNKTAPYNPAWPFSFTPLHAASGRGHSEIVNLLLENGANVNAKDPYRGQTPIIFAINERQADVIKILLKSGADLDLPLKSTSTGETLKEQVERIAKDQNRYDIIELLN